MLFRSSPVMMVVSIEAEGTSKGSITNDLMPHAAAKTMAMQTTRLTNLRIIPGRRTPACCPESKPIPSLQGCKPAVECSYDRANNTSLTNYPSTLLNRGNRVPFLRDLPPRANLVASAWYAKGFAHDAIERFSHDGRIEGCRALPCLDN